MRRIIAEADVPLDGIVSSPEIERKTFKSGEAFNDMRQW
jgi:hypothetical protein